MKRVFLLVMDSFGIGNAKDAVNFGDEGSNTYQHIRERMNLSIPNLRHLGLNALVDGHDETNLIGAFAKANEISVGKDTPSGHWEIAGLPTLFKWGYFGDQFPPKLVEEILAKTGLPGILGSGRASGTEIINRLGVQHELTGQPICYTSADSVFQIAASETTFGLGKLYDLCEVVFELVKPYRIGRVIARPFVKDAKGHFVRTNHRRDFAVAPTGNTLLDHLVAAGKKVTSVGKIADIFAHRGISRHFDVHRLEETWQAVLQIVRECPQHDELVFVNFVDFDELYGHRRDALGYGKALEFFDQQLGELMPLLTSEDLLIITADHGCDPTAAGTDHTREQVPILLYGNGYQGALGERDTFADIGQTVATYLGISPLTCGQKL